MGRRRSEPARCTSRTHVAEHCNEPTLQRLRPAIQSHVQADTLRFTLQAASLTDTRQTAEDDCEVVAVAPLHL